MSVRRQPTVTHSTEDVDRWRELPLWEGVGRLLDRVEDSSLARMHGLGPLLALRLRDREQAVPPELERDARFASLSSKFASALLHRLRDLLDEPVMVFKGPVIAARYVGGARHFHDLDLLVEDPLGVQGRLIAAGFAEIPDPEGLYTGLHHLVPLAHPEVPLLRIEVHGSPKWPYDASPPPTSEILAVGVSSGPEAHGFLIPSPAHHALLLAAHAWAHEPLGRARDLLDVAVAADGCNASELASLAEAWNLRRVWTTTHAVADALFAGGSNPWSMRLWARHLPRLRDRTVLENHLERWLSGLWGLPLAAGTAHSLRQFASDFRPAFDETWPEKLERTRTAIAGGFRARSDHDERLGEAAERGQRRNAPLDGDERPDGGGEPGS